MRVSLLNRELEAFNRELVHNDDTLKTLNCLMLVKMENKCPLWKLVFLDFDTSREPKREDYIADGDDTVTRASGNCS